MHITLKCTHRFNYLPILHEIVQQKKKNCLEITHLNSKQLKCPYCRNVQIGILPKWQFIEGVTRINGVNAPDKNINRQNKCSFLCISGKNKGNICNVPASAKYCDKHVKKHYLQKEKSKDKSDENTVIKVLQ